MATDKRSSVYFDRETNRFVGLDPQILKQLNEFYDGINVDAEIKKMCIWLSGEKSKDKAGSIGFILNWLDKATPMPPTTTEHLDLMQSNSPLGTLVREYCWDICKNQAEIYKYNTISTKS